MSKNLLTVLCPNYNNEPYLERAIQSILMQKVDFEYDVIFIDDCSKDNGVEIIEKYVALFPEKIKLFRNEKNLKTLANSLKGYEKLTTPYYTVLDPDDYWIRDDYLQKAVAFLEQHTGYNVYASNTYKEVGGKRITYHNLDSKDFAFDDLDNFVYGHTSSTVFRNTFKKADFDKIRAYIGTPNERIFEGDTFRNFFHLNTGKGRFENVFNGVYNYSQNGIWSKLDVNEQIMLEIKFYISMFRFFKFQQPDFFLKKVHEYFSLLQKNSISNNLELTNEVNTNFMQWVSDWLNFFEDSKLNLSKKIYFFLPSRYIGGYEFLFIRLTKEISKLGFDVHYVDYDEDTLARRELNNTKVSFINYTDDMNSFDFEEPVHLVTTLTWAYLMPKINNNNSLLHFWVGHPSCYNATKERANLIDVIMSNFVRALDQNNAICYVDFACFNETKRCVDFSLKENYVPIPLSNKTNLASINMVNTNEINLGWLGRLDEDKIYSIINTLDNFKEYKTSLKKRYHIIGQGSAKDLIDIEKYEDIEIIFVGPLIEEKMQAYLRKNVDLLVATGTSLLEGASLKIPALHCLQSGVPLNEKKFVWLHDMSKYTFGFYADQFDVFGYKSTMLKKAIDDVLEDKKNIAEKSYAHFGQHHAIENIVPMFLRFLLLGGLNNEEYESKEFLKGIKQTKIKGWKNKLRHKIWKKLDKKVMKNAKYKKKHPIGYEIWKHLDKKLRRKGII